MTRRSQGKLAAPGLTVRPGAHVALLYGEPSVMAEVIEYVATGIHAQERCAVLAYSRLNERFAAQLRDLHGVDVRAAVAGGSLAFLDGKASARELRAELARFLSEAPRARGSARLVLSLGFGEPAWPDDDELLRFETSLGELCHEHKAAALCLYDARQLAGSLILDGALACHPWVIYRGQTHANPFVVEPQQLQRELASRRRTEGALKAWMS
ncbi:MAG: MEDS domain-containing protein [Deltaproteobacteria bacterium]|nr:MEDS domain-containing protein [Deltaproteobacteria bacterium]